MTSAQALKDALCDRFCTAISISPVSTGYAVSTAFSDKSGDQIGFYVTKTEDGFKIEDDGDYLSSLIGLGVPIDQGTRGQLLDSILAESGAFWDRETYEIKTNTFSEDKIASRAIDFVSSLIRVRDIELLTRDVIRSTFRDDAIAMISRFFSAIAEFDEGVPISPNFAEFPADLIIRPRIKSGISGTVYFVNNNDKLNEALLLLMEQQQYGGDALSDFRVIALIEEPDMSLISKRKFQRAQNRSLSMPIFRGDEEAAMRKIGKELNLPLAA